jgi:ribosome-binding factor A
MSSARTLRVARLVQQVLGDAFLRHVHDPELRGLIVTRVEMPPDLKRATVFYEVLGSERVHPATKRALEAVRPMLQRRLARETSLRFTPVLAFQHDQQLRQADRVLALIDDLELPEEPGSSDSTEDLEGEDGT